MNTTRLHSKQRGAIVPIVVIGLLAMLAVAGLAVDGSHALANKTRAQNTVDAAALAGAKALDENPGDTALATVAANSLFTINADAAGNHELARAYDAGDITVTVQYSTTVNPFIPGSPAGPFVRVIATGFDTATTLSRVLNIDEISTPASAVAGPSGPLGSGNGATVCDIAPIAVCLDDEIAAGIPPSEEENPPSSDDDDPLRVLKPNPGQHDDIGPGNYKMLRLGCTGGACLRQNMAGDFAGCATVDETVESEPGVSSGPVSQGFNTRFGDYQGGGVNSSDHPPDSVTTGQVPELIADCENDPLPNIYLPNIGPSSGNCNSTFEPLDIVTKAGELDYSYDDYLIDSGIDPVPPAVRSRRLLIFPTIDCNGDQSGQSSLTVRGFACFFMLQPVDTGNQGQGGGQIFGQYVRRCDVNATPGVNPGGGPSPALYKIQLYRNSDSKDS